MKTKIIRFILIIVFILTAIHCSVDPIKRPLSPFLPLPQSPFHIYTEQEQHQVRESLIGRYQGVFNNQSLILDIRLDRIVYTLANTESVSQYYNVIFPLYGYGEPVLSLWIDGIFSEFSIRFSLNTYTEVIGFVIFPAPDLVMPLFHRIENNQSNPVVVQDDFDHFNNAEREWEILESLAGQYTGIINESEQVTLILNRFPSAYQINRNSVVSSGYYDVEFTPYRTVLTLESEGWRYELGIEENSVKYLLAIPYNGGILHKANNRPELHYHDEL